MDGKLGDDLLREKVQDAIGILNREDAVKKAPVYPLREQLMLRRMDELRCIADTCFLKNMSKHRKGELVAAIAEQLSDPEALSKIFFILNFFEWNFFLEVGHRQEYIADIILPDHYEVPLRLGVLQIFHHEGKCVYVVPEEIRKAMRRLKKDGFVEYKSAVEESIRHMSAATNLYGVIPLETLREPIARRYPWVTPSEFQAFVTFAQLREELFGLYKDMLVHSFFVNENNGTYVYDEQGIEDLLTIRGATPRCELPEEEFLEYADIGHFENDDDIDHLEDVLSLWFADDLQRSEIIDEIIFYLRCDAPMEAILTIPKREGAKKIKSSDAKAFRETVRGLHRHSRTWLLYGHTPDEMDGLTADDMSMPERAYSDTLLAAKSAKIVPLHGQSPAVSEKIGRNDPCPCGSGKKYKNCCGR